MRVSSPDPNPNQYPSPNPNQLHHALFARRGYVLKPAELRRLGLGLVLLTLTLTLTPTPTLTLTLTLTLESAVYTAQMTRLTP